MAARIAVVQFPGSGGVADAVHAYGTILGQDVYTVWHQEEDLKKPDILVLPGGAAFGDYLRPGALAKTSPISGAIRKFARDDGLILGLGNGFQILCELEVLPGVLLANSNSRYLNTDVHLVVENTTSPWTQHLDSEEVYRLPIGCSFGRYWADKRTLKDLEEEGRVALRFCDKDGDIDEAAPFNGSAHAIAAIVSRHNNVLGIMCHPERAVEKLMGGTDGLGILQGPLLGERKVAEHDDDEDDEDDDD